MNDLKDVRASLKSIMHELNDSEATAEDMQTRIARAKAMSQVTAAHVETYKLELKAVETAANAGLIDLSDQQQRDSAARMIGMKNDDDE